MGSIKHVPLQENSFSRCICGEDGSLGQFQLPWNHLKRFVKLLIFKSHCQKFKDSI